MVRVPLGGRRVRGWVVERAVRPALRLKPVAARSGDGVVFDAPLLDSLRWASEHYVTPISVMLQRATPPNVPPAPEQGGRPAAPLGISPLPAVTADAAAGRRRPAVAWVRPGVSGGELAALVAPVLAAGRGVTAITATAAEATELATGLAAAGLEPVVVSSELDDRAVTRAWARAQGAACLLVGTPRVAAWRLADFGLAVVLEEGRRAMKDRQTPTVHVRDLLRTRSVREGFTLVFAGPTPTVETIGMGAEVAKAPGRPWGLVEVLDRRQEPPGGRLLLPATRQAIRAVTDEGGTTFVFAHRRDYAAALRCVACRTLRRCTACGSRPGNGDVCARCGTRLGPCSNCAGERFEPLGAGVGRLVEEVTGLVGPDRVDRHPADTPVTVGTERDLADLPMRDLVVLVDADGLLLGTNYRAAEETLRIGARLAGRVRRGRRLIVQTAEPGHPVIEALRRADPLAFTAHELEARSTFGYPPTGELLVVELRGTDDAATPEHDDTIRRAAGAVSVMGPMSTAADTRRWLLWAPRLHEARKALRPVVQRLRENGVTVRVDADPIDL